MNKLAKIFVCFVPPLLVGGIAGFLTRKEIPGWYSTLQKPSFNPPNYLFGPVWTLLYILMGVSLFRLITIPNVEKKRAYLIYSVQLVMNFLWSIFFFSCHQIGVALLDIILLWMTIILLILTYIKIDKTAGFLQIPYLAWVSFAAILNASIYYLN